LRRNDWIAGGSWFYGGRVVGVELGGRKDEDHGGIRS
jgi:hypothetical protein